MNAPTKDTIQSAGFGTFAPQPSTPLATKEGELLAMAGGVVKGLWEIPDSVFNELPQRLAELAMSENPRTACKAAKLLIEMNGQNSPAEQGEQCGGVTILLPHNGRLRTATQRGGGVQ